MKVGFIGLGRMGKGMASRIQGAGHELTVYDVVREATAEFAAAGARVADSIADVCKGSEVIVTMLVEDSTVTDVVLRAGGMRDSLASGADSSRHGNVWRRYDPNARRRPREGRSGVGRRPGTGASGSCRFGTTGNRCCRSVRNP